MDNHNKPTSSEDANPNTLLSLKETVSNEWQRILDRSQNDKTRLGLVANKFIQKIETYHRTQHSPKFYAAELNMGKSNLRKICQRSIDVSPTSCIYVRIMLEACILLEDVSRSVKEIASDLGFDDPIYFSRFFKK
ncbi:MAG: helix-turn-helix domain-containing protein, partial [Saprospiraceae bacterium]|nr:helix-turn-helix domain-containing protein [Saprospiraceae bacterium]